MGEILRLTDKIGEGATRQCFLHPHDKTKCIKVMNDPALTSVLLRELQSFNAVYPILHDYIVTYDKTLVDTDHGMGLVCELLQDDNGSVSQSFEYYMKQQHTLEMIKSDLDAFVHLIISNDLFFSDFNPRNFVIQLKNGQYRLRYIDLKSYRVTKFWTYLKLEHVIPALRHHIMLRRLKKLYARTGLPFPC